MAYFLWVPTVEGVQEHSLRHLGDRGKGQTPGRKTGKAKGEGPIVNGTAGAWSSKWVSGTPSSER